MPRSYKVGGEKGSEGLFLSTPNVHHPWSFLRSATHLTPFCYDDKPTVGDLYLVPQLYNSRLFEIDLSPYPLLCAIDERCRALPAFDKAMPFNQPDYPENPEGYR